MIENTHCRCEMCEGEAEVRGGELEVLLRELQGSISDVGDAVHATAMSWPRGSHG